MYEAVEPYLFLFQHGFVKGKSCLTQLLQVYHPIGVELDDAGHVDAVFLDLAKAFDSVPHRLLLHKIQSFGILQCTP